MPVCAVVIQKTSGLSLRCSCWRCCDPVFAHVVVGICHGDTNHGSTCCSGGECPSDLQHCLGLFLSCPPFLVLLNLLGQPRALCCPAAEGAGKAFMPIRDIWFVECRWQVVKERRMTRGIKGGKEGQLCAAAFECFACGPRGISGSWLPELSVLCQKTSLPTLVTETGPFCWGCLWSPMACKKVLVQAQRRDVTVSHLKLYFLIQHVSQDRDRANSAAVIKVM